MSELFKLDSWECRNLRVIVRADLNVSLASGQPAYKHRLFAIKPTLDYLLKKGAQVILLTHLGRPKGHEQALSTRQLIPWFKNQGYDIGFAPTLKDAQTAISSLVLCENLRFFPGELTQDMSFAQDLAKLGTFYVNDAFGICHRTDTSIAILPRLFSYENRSSGLLIEKEHRYLSKIKNNPQRPYMVIVGGKKIRTKIPLVHDLLPFADSIAVCPALVFTFLHAQKKPVGQSLIEVSSVEKARTILTSAGAAKTELIFPVDYQVTRNSIDGPLCVIAQNQFTQQTIGVSIGPETEKLLHEKIMEAGTVFFNGISGFVDRPGTLQGVQTIFEAMQDTKAYTVIAGGDTVAAAYQLGITSGIDHFSTGGGAALAYLAGHKLPGLLALGD